MGGQSRASKKRARAKEKAKQKQEILDKEMEQFDDDKDEQRECTTNMSEKHKDDSKECGHSRASKKRARAKAKAKQKQAIGMNDEEENQNEVQPLQEKCASKRNSGLIDSNSKQKGDDDEEKEANTNNTSQEETSHKKKKKRRITENEHSKNHPLVNDTVTAFLNKLSIFPTIGQILQIPECIESCKEEDIVTFQNATAEERGHALLASLLHPSATVDEFYEEYWEKKPLYIEASTEHSRRFQGLLTKSEIEKLLKKHPLRYGEDINITNFCKDAEGIPRRITLDPDQNSQDSFIDPDFLWTKFNTSGCSIRLLCPQKYVDTIHSLLSTLETHFGCMIGCNAYLTPSRNHQGFAPHYDDIEAFVLQLQGEKRWRVYAPFTKEDTLPRASSEDYTPEEMEGVEPILDITLKPGDLLYMPRGYVHQAHTTSSGEDSLHLTVSAMQNWAWCDFLEVLMPNALDAAVNGESVSMREGLPRNFLGYMGIMHAVEDEDDDSAQKSHDKEEPKDDYDDEENHDSTAPDHTLLQTMQNHFRTQAKKRVMKLCHEAFQMIDRACDEMGKRFLSDRLPPSLTPNESKFTSSELKDEGYIFPNTFCRIVQPGIARLVVENDKAVLYHCADNAREYHGNALSPLEFELDDAPALETLIKTAEPDWVRVSDLVHEGELEDKIEVAKALYAEGILANRQPDPE